MSNQILVPSTLDMKDATLLKLNHSITQASSGVTVCYGNKVQYALTDSDGNDNMLVILTSDLATYEATNAFADLNNWTVTKVAEAFPSNMKAKFAVKGKITVASLDGYNYFFWQSKDNSYMALQVSPEVNPDMKIATLNFTDPSFTVTTTVNGNAITTLTSNLAAFIMPNQADNSAGKIGLLAVGTRVYQGTTTTIMIGVTLDPAQFVENQNWNYFWSGVTYILDQSNRGKNNPQISANWTNLGATVVGKNKLSSNIYAIVAYNDDKTPFWSFGFDLMEIYGGANPLRTVITTIDSTKLSHPAKASIIQAPDGSILLQMINSDTKRPKLSLLQPNTAASTDSSHYGKPLFYQPTWQMLPIAPSHDSHNSPCAAFIPMQMTRGQVTVPLPNGKQQTYNNAYLQPYVYLGLISNSNHKPMMYTYFWGTMVGLMNYAEYTPIKQKASQSLVNLVADTFPYPVPNPLVENVGSASGLTDWSLCNYEYLVGNDNSTEVEIALNGSLGTKFGNVVNEGVGPVTDFALSAGASSIVNNSIATRKETSYNVISKGISPALTSKPTVNNSLSIAMEGSLFCTTQMPIIQDVMVFVPRQDIQPQMGISPLRTGVLRPNAKNIIPIQGQFATYCYTPGNLNSYNEKAINQKMFDSYNKLSAKDQSAFVINGEDFSSFYTSQDYCKAIIKRFGFSGVGAEPTLSRLEFAFAETSSRKEEFQSTTAFTDSAGLFVDFSAYVGAYAGEGLEVFGFGEDVGVYAGITATLKTSETTIRKDSKDWGIKLSNYLNSLAPGEAYSVQMYLLKPNPLWAVEAALFGRQKGLDTQASSPIRIMFIVPYVSPTLKARLKTVFPA